MLGQAGHVNAILSIADGVAAIDSDGDVAADDIASLDGLRISPSDLKRHAKRYTAGIQLWLGKTSHFSACQAQVKVSALDTPTRRGSVVVEPQAVSQAIPITGTSYSLEYQTIRSLA